MPLEGEERSRAGGKNQRLCWGVRGTGMNAYATERRVLVRYYSTVTADMLLRRR